MSAKQQWEQAQKKYPREVEFIDKIKDYLDKNNNDDDYYLLIKLLVENVISDKFNISEDVWFYNNIQNLNNNFNNYFREDDKIIHKLKLKQQITKILKSLPKPTQSITSIITEKTSIKKEEEKEEKQLDINLNTKDLDKILSGFSTVMTDIIDELINFVKTTEHKTIDNKFDLLNYILDYLKNFFLIITKQGRMFYVGLLMFGISILLLFI